jgi:hypothetical protein
MFAIFGLGGFFRAASSCCDTILQPLNSKTTSVSQTLRDIIFSLAPAFAGATAFNYDL